MKKCECGKDMEDWMKICKDCFKAQHPKTETTRDESIQRQTAAKCTAMSVDSKATDEGIERRFGLFLKLIRGE